MSGIPTLDAIERLARDPRVRPWIYHPAVSGQLQLADGGEAEGLLREVGLLGSFADWFTASETVRDDPCELTIGTSPFGRIVVDCETFRVLYRDDDAALSF